MPHPRPSPKLKPKTAIVFLNKDNEVRWSAYCPAHGNKTSNYQGQDDYGLLFRCADSTDHLSHLFHVPPDPSGPKSVEEIAGWKAKQLASRLVDTKRQ